MILLNISAEWTEIIDQKKVKSLKNYITGYYEGIKHSKINSHEVIKEMEEKNLLFLGLNSEIIYNF